MAKKQKPEKLYSKSINWGCRLIALILTILAIYAYGFLIGDITVGPIDLNNFDANMFSDMNEDTMYVIPPLILSAILAILQVIALINVIRLVIGTLTFLGKKESHKMAKKLAKHSKIAFAVVGTAIGVVSISSLDDGMLPEGATGLFVFSGIVAFLIYAAVRYYRWFVVEKKPYVDMIFPVVRDLAFFALPLIALAVVIGETPLGDAIKVFSMLMSGISSDFITMESVETLMLSILEIFMAFLAFAALKAAFKFIPFNNYKKPAASKIVGKFLGMLIYAILFIGGYAASVTFIGGSGDINGVIEVALLHKDLLITLLLFTIGAYVLASVDSDEDRETRLPEKKPELATADAAEDDEAETAEVEAEA